MYLCSNAAVARRGVRKNTVGPTRSLCNAAFDLAPAKGARWNRLTTKGAWAYAKRGDFRETMARRDKRQRGSALDRGLSAQALRGREPASYFGAELLHPLGDLLRFRPCPEQVVGDLERGEDRRLPRLGDGAAVHDLADRAVHVLRHGARMLRRGIAPNGVLLSDDRDADAAFATVHRAAPFSPCWRRNRVRSSRCCTRSLAASRRARSSAFSFSSDAECREPFVCGAAASSSFTRASAVCARRRHPAISSPSCPMR